MVKESQRKPVIELVVHLHTPDGGELIRKVAAAGLRGVEVRLNDEPDAAAHDALAVTAAHRGLLTAVAVGTVAVGTVAVVRVAVGTVGTGEGGGGSGRDAPASATLLHSGLAGEGARRSAACEYSREASASSSSPKWVGSPAHVLVPFHLSPLNFDERESNRGLPAVHGLQYKVVQGVADLGVTPVETAHITMVSDRQVGVGGLFEPTPLYASGKWNVMAWCSL